MKTNLKKDSLRYVLVSLLLIACSLPSLAQKSHVVHLPAQSIKLAIGGFYIDSIIDVRADTTHIGFVQKGFFNKKYTANFQGGLPLALRDFYAELTYLDPTLEPVTIKVLELDIKEITKVSSEYARAKISVEFYANGVLVYRDKLEIEATGLDVTKYHTENLSKILIKIIRHFDRSNWREKVNPRIEKYENSDSVVKVAMPHTPQELDFKPKKVKKTNRNSVALGYQIGGFTLIGIDYEVRVSDYFGVHFGGGFAGYTAGLKVHTNANKTSPFFNLNYKDGGFGLLETAGIEYGGRIPFSRGGSFGLHLQGGVGKILSIDPTLLSTLFNTPEAPNYMFTLGVGLGW